MARGIYSCLVITFLIKISVASICTITDKSNCYFTVKCTMCTEINIVPYCNDTDPYITLVINESPVHKTTANFFKTQFDEYVRILTGIGNTWKALRNNAFSNFKNVLYMDLSENQIKRIGKPFSGLDKLASLNLSRNYLKVIKPDVISKNKNRLSLLDLSYNLLTYLSKDVFVNMLYLRQLYLQGNQLTQLEDMFTMNLKNLNYLNLCCSNMTTFDINLKDLKSLRELDLSFNNLKKIDVSEIVSLEVINLSHNEFEEFMFDSFEQFPSLEMLDLSYNKLKEIYGSDSVEHDNRTKPLIDIYLSNNNINYIDKTFMKTFNNIRMLDLSYNDIAEFKPKILYSRLYIQSRYS